MAKCLVEKGQYQGDEFHNGFCKVAENKNQNVYKKIYIIYTFVKLLIFFILGYLASAFLL